MKKSLSLALVVMFLLSPVVVFGCLFDGDCQINQLCNKGPLQPGVCVKATTSSPSIRKGAPCNAALAYEDNGTAIIIVPILQYRPPQGTPVYFSFTLKFSGAIFSLENLRVFTEAVKFNQCENPYASFIDNDFIITLPVVDIGVPNDFVAYSATFKYIENKGFLLTSAIKLDTSGSIILTGFCSDICKDVRSACGGNTGIDLDPGHARACSMCRKIPDDGCGFMARDICLQSFDCKDCYTSNDAAYYQCLWDNKCPDVQSYSCNLDWLWSDAGMSYLESIGKPVFDCYVDAKKCR